MGRSTFLSSIAGRFARRPVRSEEQTDCGRQAEVAEYWESRADGGEQPEIETHIAGCDDCRELLVVLTRTPLTEPASLLTDEMVNRQVELIRGYVANDQHHRSAAAAGAGSSERPNTGFYISFPQLAVAALIISAIGFGVIFLATRDNRVESANKILAAAMAEHGRNTQGCLSELNYAAYSSVRGAEEDNLKFTLALNKLKDIDEQRASDTERVALARARIATGNQQEVARGLESLLQLSNIKSLQPELKAEVFNDEGVAQLHLRQYESAIENFSKAIATSPGLVQARFNHAIALEAAGHYDEAKVGWQEFITSAADERWKQEARGHLVSLRVGDSVK